MGIFTRFRDIIHSNLNAMLDKAEDPEKLIKLMIREMEDTLVEIKASCAGVMAESKKIHRQLDEAESRAKYWGEKAELAVNRDRDDLARRAAKMAVLIKTPERVDAICSHIVNHFRQKIEPNGFKAQAVTFDRECCHLYKQVFDKLLCRDGASIGAVIERRSHVLDLTFLAIA